MNELQNIVIDLEGNDGNAHAVIGSSSGSKSKSESGKKNKKASKKNKSRKKPKVHGTLRGKCLNYGWKGYWKKDDSDALVITHGTGEFFAGMFGD